MTETPQEKAPSPEEGLEAFRREMTEIKAREMDKKEAWIKSGRVTKKEEQPYDPHFDNIDPDHLEEKDRQTYQNLELLDPYQFAELRHERFLDLKEEDDAERFKSLHDFWAFMTNKWENYRKSRMDYARRHLNKDAEIQDV